MLSNSSAYSIPLRFPELIKKPQQEITPLWLANFAYVTECSS
jgi:hypothetical protein